MLPQFALLAAIVIAMLSFPAQTVLAGSVTGLSSSTQAINCDVRRSNGDTSWCTAGAADQIFAGCFVIVRSDSDPLIKSCDWQSCGPVAFVGARPKKIGGSVVEYGLSTPHSLAANPPPSWMLNKATNEILPKFPFPRNYLTIAEFAARRSSCLSGQSATDEVQRKICPIDKQFFESSSYFACLKRHRPTKVGNNL